MVFDMDKGMNRRDFMQMASLVGTGMLFTPKLFAQEVEAVSPNEMLNIAIIGAGRQGRVLIQACLNIPNVRFRALCDIWEYNKNYGSNILGKFDQPVNVYVDYREMLEKEKDLDAVLIASPDFVHHEHAIACLEAGLHVYCEKEMSNTLENARAMVEAARRTGKLLQIGHQRRSNPRYFHALQLINKDKLLGRITNFQGQWNRPVQEQFAVPEKYLIDDATLKQFGYGNMQEFMNWRMYKQYSGGLISDLGSHQIDVFSWFLDAMPSAVMAAGGVDYYQDGREWYDNVMTIYEYPTAAGKVRGFYQVLSTTSHGGYYETFMGDEGTMVVSEDTAMGQVFRETIAKKREWEDESEKIESMGREAITLKIGESRRKKGGEADPEVLKMEEDAQKPIHQPHLENFFKAITDGTALNCPGETGYETCVAVLKANEAVAAGQRIEFDPKEFVI